MPAKYTERSVVQGTSTTLTRIFSGSIWRLFVYINLDTNYTFKTKKRYKMLTTLYRLLNQLLNYLNTTSKTTEVP